MAYKILLVGAGSLQFGCDIMGDIFNTPSLYGSEIRLLDINPNAMEVTRKKGEEFIEKNDLPFTVKSFTDRKESLKGVDFVVISIEVGDRFQQWDQDWKIPMQYGVKQIYGENGGPGGLFHSLRIIPPILEICDDIYKICPEAFVFNFSNPMSRICTTIHRKYPELKFIGLCHEIASMEKHLPEILDCSYSDLEIRAGGLNHFSCLLEVWAKKDGKDLYPRVKEKASEYFRDVPSYSEYLAHYYETGKFMLEEGSRKKNALKAMAEWGERRVLQVILERFDLLAITSDSHFGEYIQWAYEVADHKAILDFYQYYRSKLGNDEAKIELRYKERIANIIDGIVSDKGFVEEAVNIPNKGYIDDLPEWIAVEVPATINANGIKGLSLNVPAGFKGLLSNQIAVHDMTAEAVLTGSRKAVVQALLVDPVVNVYRGLDKMVDTFLFHQKKFLGYIK